MKLEDIRLSAPYLCLEPPFFDFSTIAPLKAPFLIAKNSSFLESLGVELSDDLLVKWLNGEVIHGDVAPFSMCYAGHQFGSYVSRLGDGRAINLGKLGAYNLQLKGAGETLYSRMADGRAVLRSSIREYLMAEAMHALGIASTRSVAIIGSQEKVVRQQLEKGAIVMRASTSWVRFGSFEYFYYEKQHDKLEALMDFVIEESYPELMQEEKRYLKVFEAVLKRTAKMVAQWQCVGFNHGVMNTDNMSIEGLTIDYGPYAFLDDFDFHNICNKTDQMGRYSYGNQPNVAFWNVKKLSIALSPIISEEAMKLVLEQFVPLYSHYFVTMMFEKIGIFTASQEDEALLKTLLHSLQEANVDFTLFFRTLSRYDGDDSKLLDIAINPTALKPFLALYKTRLEQETLSTKERHRKMLKINPKYVLKNYMLQEAIEAAEQGDFSKVETLMQLAIAPFDEHPSFEHYAKATPNAFKNQKLSCSS